MRFALLLTLAGAPVQAQEAPAPVSVPTVECGDETTPAQQVVVCGSRSGSERYRLPKALRSRSRAPGVSWSARQREESKRSRFAGAAVGLGSELKWEARTDYEWREGRKAMRKERTEWEQFTTAAK